MKKIFIIVLMLTYGLSSSGMTVSLHYCCGKLDGVSFSAKHKTGCAKDNEVRKSSCCHDQQISLKVSSEQETVAKWVQNYKAQIAVPVSRPAFIVFTQHLLSPTTLARGTPEPSLSVPLFIRHCIFII